MRTLRQPLALLGAIALASSLVACSNGPTEVNADDTEEQSQARNGTSISSINADNVEGVCLQVFGSTEDVYEKLQLDVSESAQFGYATNAENGGWGDEYFPDQGSKPATIRCVAEVNHENDSGTKENLSVIISVAVGADDPQGNVGVTVSADGLTAGLQSLARSGSGMESRSEGGIVEESVGKQFITDEVLPKFTP